MKGPTYHRDRITDDAAEWFVRVQGADFSQEDKEAFADWLSGSAEHVREYLQLAVLETDIRDMTELPTADELIDLARADDGNTNIIALRVGEGSQATPLKEGTDDKAGVKWLGWAVAAVFVLAVMSVSFMAFNPSSKTYSTGLGEQQSFPLEDGSIVRLNAYSTIEVQYSYGERLVTLHEGEALFDVAKDSGRPFFVRTGDASIQAVGTAFNVRKRGQETVVTVTQGIVEVAPNKEGALPQGFAPVRMKVGQQTSVMAAAPALHVVAANMRQVTAWRDRRLLFEGWPLAAVVKEFNLYNEAKIRIESDRVAKRKVSGAFSADDNLSFTQFLEATGIAAVKRVADGTVILSDRQP